MKMKIISINHKNKGKPHFIDINAYHHTIYPHDSLDQYYAPIYKLCQTKIVNDQLYTIAINDGIRSLDENISTIHQRRFKHRKRLYPDVTKSIDTSIYLSDRPHLYKLEFWSPFRSDSLEYYKTHIEPLASYDRLDKSKKKWHCDKLEVKLHELLWSNLDYMMQSVLETAPPSEYYINIQPDIYSQTTKHMHGQKGTTYPEVFNLYFTSNLYIPTLLSIGQAISIGYGTIIEV